MALSLTLGFPDVSWAFVVHSLFAVFLGFILQTCVWLEAFWLGWNLLGRPPIGKTSFSRYGEIFLVCGWFAQAWWVGLTGMLGLLDKPWLWLWVVLPILGGVLDRKAMAALWLLLGQTYRTWFRVSNLWLWIGFFNVAWVLFHFLAPNTHWDLMNYEFGQPIYWLAEGKILAPANDLYAFVCLPLRWHYTWDLGLWGASMALANLVFACFLASLITMRLLAEEAHLPQPWPFIGGLMILQVPGLWELMVLKKDDLVMPWLGSSLLLLIFSITKEKNYEARVFISLGILLTTVFLEKLGVTLGFILGCFALTFTSLWKHKRAPFLSSILVWTGTSLLALTPLFVFVGIHLGNPLALRFPYLSSNLTLSSTWVLFFRAQQPWRWTSLKLQVQEFLKTIADMYNPNEWIFGEFLGFFILLALPLALASTRSKRWPFLWFTGFLGTFLTLQHARYFLVMLPLEILLIVPVYQQLFDKIRILILFTTLFILHIGIFTTWLSVGKLWTQYILGALPTEKRIYLQPPVKDLCQKINRSQEFHRSRLLFIGESRYWPCHVRFVYVNPFFGHPFNRIPPGMSPESWWDKYIEQEKITHIVYHPRPSMDIFTLPAALEKRVRPWLQSRSQKWECLKRWEESICLVTLKRGKMESVYPKALPFSWQKDNPSSNRKGLGFEPLHTVQVRP